MDILLFHPDSEKSRILSFALESHSGVTVRQVPALEQAMGRLLEDRPVDLIVTTENEYTPLFFKYLLSVGSKLPVILIKTEGQQAATPSGVNIVRQIGEASALRELAEYIEKNAKPEGDSIEALYCRIGVELLLRIGSLEGDVFIRLSSIKFVKLMNAGTAFTAKDLERFWGVKKIDYLYILKPDLPPFMKRLQQELVKLSQSSVEGDETVFATLGQVQETIHGIAQKVGMTEEVMELTRAHVDLALQVIGQSPRLRKAVFAVLSKKDNYIGNHSVQLAYVACCISSKLNWPSNLTFQKLIFAAFMHDIALANQDFAQIQTKEQLLQAKAKLSHEEYVLIESHMFTAGELANRFPQIPSDVYQIIVQHHERPDGSGFPRGMGGSLIAPLAAVFITAHEIVDLLDEFGDEAEMERFWQERVGSYTTGTFKKILRAFGSTDSVA